MGAGVGQHLHLGGFHEQQRQGAAEEIHHRKGKQCIGNTDDGAAFQALTDAVQLTGAHVLAAVGGHGGTHGIERADQELAHLAACGNGGHRRGAQTVHRCLQHNGAQCGDGILQARGNAHADQMLDALTAEFPVLLLQEQGITAENVMDAQDHRYALGSHRSPCCAGNAHMEAQNEQHIQRHIEQRAENQVDDRRAGIAQRTDDAKEHIVEKHDGNAEKNDENIVMGILEDVLGGVHPMEEGIAQYADQRGHHSGKHHGQHDGVGHKALHALIIPLAEFLRHGNHKAVAHTHAKAQHQKVQRTGGANACQRLHAQKLTHHDGIHHVVDLLEQHAQQQGNQKANNQPRWGAFRHIAHSAAVHGDLPPEKMSSATVYSHRKGFARGKIIFYNVF